MRTNVPLPVRPACEAMVRNYADRYGAAFGLTARDVLGRRRTADHVRARNAVMRRLWEDGFSSPEIGALLDRDHTTVLFALGRLNR